MVAISALALAGAALLGPAAPARAADDPNSAASIGAAILADPAVLTGAQFVAMPPDGLTAIAGTRAIAGFPKAGTSYGLLSSGVARALYPPDPEDPDSDLNEARGGDAVRGDTDRDVTILRIDVNLPTGTNCLVGLDFRFFSIEYPEYVGSKYNDAFIFEIDQSTWSTLGSEITAPGDLAFDELGNIISINAAGAATMTAALATGTSSDGSTRTLTASAPITAGQHSLYFSIFDQGDMILDSAVLLDNLRFGQVADPATQCKPGVVPVTGAVLTAPAPTFTDGANPSYTIPNDPKVTYTADGNPVSAGIHEASPGDTVVIVASVGGDDVLQGASSWSHTWPGDATALTPVAPAAPVFKDVAGTDNDTVTIPSTTGVVYYLNDEQTAAGTYPGSGFTSVSAEADTGFALAGPSSWTFHFADQPETGTITAPAPTADLDAGTFTIPASSAITYYANWEEVSAGAHPGSGTVTIVAEANDPDATLVGASTWSFTFSNADLNIVTAKAPTFTDNPSGAGTITIPSTVGVIYQINGVPADAGTHPGIGPVTVTAVASVGYAVNGVTGWSHLFAWASATTVTATPPTFTDPDGTAQDTYTIPAKVGVRYLVGGDVVASGVYPVDPSEPEVTITAVATAGYVLSGPSVFTHTFTGTTAPPAVIPGVPTISGTAQVGATLNVAPGNWTPADATLAFAWLADGGVIPGATGTSYVIAAGDLGRRISVQVTGSAPAYTSSSATSPQTGPVIAGTLAAGVPTIQGVGKVGEKLTAVPGDWQPAPVTLSYQWNRNGSPIPTATAADYSVQASDAGSQVTVTVTGSKTGYGTVSQTSAAVGIASAPTPPPSGKVLTKTPTPTISGTARVGSTLKAKPGKWKPAPVSLSYQWYAAGVPIPAATKASYTLTAAELGMAMTVGVTGAKSGYTPITKVSKATKKVAAGKLSTATPKISGKARVGSTITAKPGKWKPAPVTLAFQWYRSGTAIDGATAASYLVSDVDRGKTLKVKVTGTKAGYTTASKTSKGEKVPKGSQAIVDRLGSGGSKMAVGSTLSVDPGSWKTLPVSLSYQWMRSGKEISGAIGSTYTLTPADRGKSITVRVIGTSPGKAPVAHNSAPTGKVS